MSGPTSAEQLDSMLEAGSITRDDYDKLRRAMGVAVAPDAPEPQPIPETAAAPARKWRRSPVDMLIAGVCGGIAEGLGINAWALRAALLFWLLLESWALAHVIGLPILIGIPISLAVPAYVVAWIAMPLDASRLGSPRCKVRAADRSEIARFTAFIAATTLAGIVFLAWIAPLLVERFSEINERLPWLTRLAMLRSDGVRRNVAGAVYWFGIAPVCRIVFYSKLPRLGARRFYFVWLAANFLVGCIGLALPFLR